MVLLATVFKTQVFSTCYPEFTGFVQKDQPHKSICTKVSVFTSRQQELIVFLTVIFSGNCTISKPKILT